MPRRTSPRLPTPLPSPALPRCPCRTPWEAQDLWVEYWTQCDQTLGQMVKERVQEARKGRDGAALPPAAAQAHGKA